MKKPTKNILLVHSSNDLYGASKILITIIEALIKSGHSVHLVLPENGHLNNHESLNKLSVSIINLGVFRKKYFNFFGLINRLFFIIKSTFQIKKIINVYDIDLVYTNTSTVVSPTFAAYLSKVPSIFHVHEIPFGSKLYTKFLTNIFNLFSKKIIAVSNSTRDFWLKKGVINNKITVINNGFNLNFSSKKKIVYDKVVFTNISRIIPYKGHLFLIELFNELFKFRKDLTLNIIGDTLPEYECYYNELKEKVREYNLQHNINFMGFKSDVRKYLNSSNFFIHCPISPDPLPTVIFEAITCNLPVICTNQGGAYEILDSGNNGLLIDCLSTTKSCELIIKYIDDNDLQENHINDSKSFVEKNFQISSFNNNLKKLITDLVNKT